MQWKKASTNWSKKYSYMSKWRNIFSSRKNSGKMIEECRRTTLPVIADLRGQNYSNLKERLRRNENNRDFLTFRRRAKRMEWIVLLLMINIGQLNQLGKVTPSVTAQWHLSRATHVCEKSAQKVELLVVIHLKTTERRTTTSFTASSTCISEKVKTPTISRFSTSTTI